MKVVKYYDENPKEILHVNYNVYMSYVINFETTLGMNISTTLCFMQINRVYLLNSTLRNIKAKDISIIKIKWVFFGSLRYDTWSIKSTITSEMIKFISMAKGLNR